jgi:hypothetical protein
VDGDEGHAEVRHDCLLDGLGVVQLHGKPVLDVRALQSTLRDVPGRRPLLPEEQRTGRQLMGRDLPPSGPRMAGGDDQDQLVQQSGGEALLTRRQPVIAHDAEVELVRPDPFLDQP